jgi:hypothetical protein
VAALHSNHWTGVVKHSFSYSFSLKEILNSLHIQEIIIRIDHIHKLITYTIDHRKISHVSGLFRYFRKKKIEKTENSIVENYHQYILSAFRMRFRPIQKKSLLVESIHPLYTNEPKKKEQKWSKKEYNSTIHNYVHVKTGTKRSGGNRNVGKM